MLLLYYSQIGRNQINQNRMKSYPTTRTTRVMLLLYYSQIERNQINQKQNEVVRVTGL